MPRFVFWFFLHPTLPPSAPRKAKTSWRHVVPHIVFQQGRPDGERYLARSPLTPTRRPAGTPTRTQTGRRRTCRCRIVKRKRWGKGGSVTLCTENTNAKNTVCGPPRATPGRGVGHVKRARVNYCVIAAPERDALRPNRKAACAPHGQKAKKRGAVSGGRHEIISLPPSLSPKQKKTSTHSSAYTMQYSTGIRHIVYENVSYTCTRGDHMAAGGR